MDTVSVRMECMKLAVTLALPNRDVELVAQIADRLYAEVVKGPAETPNRSLETGGSKVRGKDKPETSDPFA